MRLSHFFALMVLCALPLTGCETVQRDIEQGFAQMRSDFQQTFALLEAPEQSFPSDEAAADEAEVTITATAPVKPGSKPKTPDSITLTKTKPTPAEPPIQAASKSLCPEVRVVQDLNQVHQFVDAAKPRADQAISSARITGISDYCSVVGNNVAVDITLGFAGSIGPKGRVMANEKPSFAYPYFIAITNAQGSIIAKDAFAVTMSYDGDQKTETRTEQVRQMIPTSGGNPGSYRVLIGFQLTDQELAFNRSQKDVSQIEPAAGGN
jgi:hypothetical protein